MKNKGSEKLNILYLPRWYPNRDDPMPGLFIERHARSVSPFTHVSVLYVHPDEKLKVKKYDIVESRDYELYQVKVYYKNCKSGIGFYDKIVNLTRFVRSHLKGFKLVRINSGSPDIIHVNVLTRLGILALLYKVFTGKPYVITEHWTRYLPTTDTYHGFLRKILTKIVVRNASAVLPVTLNLQKAMESRGLKNRNYHVIPNVVDTEKFTPVERPGKNEKKTIVHVSCFEDKQKNISGLLRVLKKLSELRQDWVCQMVGDGIHFDSLKKYAVDIELKEPFVIFNGLKEGEQLVNLMSTADFQVMFSRYENLPVVILESYSCGVPVLSTNVGGIYEHMNDDLGLLIPSEDEPALFEKLNYMLDNIEKFESQTIRKYAVEHFSKEVIGKQLYEVYRQIAEKAVKTDLAFNKK